MLSSDERNMPPYYAKSLEKEDLSKAIDWYTKNMLEVLQPRSDLFIRTEKLLETERQKYPHLIWSERKAENSDADAAANPYWFSPLEYTLKSVGPLEPWEERFANGTRVHFRWQVSKIIPELLDLVPDKKHREQMHQNLGKILEHDIVFYPSKYGYYALGRN